MTAPKTNWWVFALDKVVIAVLLLAVGLYTNTRLEKLKVDLSTAVLDRKQKVDVTTAAINALSELSLATTRACLDIRIQLIARTGSADSVWASHQAEIFKVLEPAIEAKNIAKPWVPLDVADILDAEMRRAMGTVFTCSDEVKSNEAGLEDCQESPVLEAYLRAVVEATDWSPPLAHDIREAARTKCVATGSDRTIRIFNTP
jgi:hypothetical protein